MLFSHKYLKKEPQSKMKRKLTRGISCFLILVFMFTAFSFTFAAADRAEDDFFDWKNMKQLEFITPWSYNDKNPYPYIIGLDARGSIRVCDMYNDSFADVTPSLKAMRGVRSFIADYSYWDEGLYVAAVNDDGTVSVAWPDTVKDERLDAVRTDAARLKNVVSLTQSTPGSGFTSGLIAVLADGRVAAVGGELNSDMTAWRGIKNVYSMRNGNYIGLREDGTCVFSGECFTNQGEVPYPSGLDFSAWEDVADVYPTPCPWAILAYALTEDGRLIDCFSEVIAEDVVSVHFDGMTYHLYYVCKDGRCGEYCSEGCVRPDRYGISAVGARGMAVGLDGELVPASYGEEKSEYTYGLYTDFDCRKESDARISGVIYRIYGENTKYIVACEDGKYRVVMDNE